MFDADGLTGEHLAEIDFLPVEADAAAGRDSGCPVMKRIGHIGIVTQNISDKYIVLPKLEPIAKVDFTILETPARKLYSGQHGFGSEIWPFRQHLQKTRDELANDPRVDGPVPVKPRALASGTEPLASLARRQIEADRMHGFPVDVPDDEARCNQLSKDLVGLMGEIGEFANLPRECLPCKFDCAEHHDPSVCVAWWAAGGTIDKSFAERSVGFVAIAEGEGTILIIKG